MKRTRHIILLLLATILFIVSLSNLSGCICTSRQKTANCHYTNPQKKISLLARVDLIELENLSQYPQISSDLTETLYHQLQKQQVFGLTIIKKTDPLWQQLLLPPAAPYNLQQLKSIRETLKCNALIVGSVTQYQPYPHLSIAIRLKMIDLADGQIIWGYEQIWDTSDKSTAERMEKYIQSYRSENYAGLRRQLAPASSIEFLNFVCFEIAQSL